MQPVVVQAAHGIVSRFVLCVHKAGVLHDVTLQHLPGCSESQRICSVASPAGSDKQLHHLHTARRESAEFFLEADALTES